MAGTISAGIMLYRIADGTLEVLIAHPGGPFWARKDAGAWSIPKGIVEEGEDPRDTARREFIEEIGLDPGEAEIDLGEVKLRSGKTVVAWAVAGDFEPGDLDSHILEIEHPRGSGRKIRFPEIDRVMWAKPKVAGEKLNPAQVPLVERLLARVGSGT